MSSFTILRVDASPRAASLSRQLADGFVDAIDRRGKSVLRRDLAADPPPVIDADWVEAEFVPPDQRDARLREALAVSDVLVDEVEAADLIVLSTPIYNFSVPAALKAWLDQIVRTWRTVAFDPAGPRGMLAGKRVVLILTAGLRYGPDAELPEFAESLVRTLFKFLGAGYVEVIRCEGQLAGARGAMDAVRAEADLRTLAASLSTPLTASPEPPGG